MRLTQEDLARDLAADLAYVVGAAQQAAQLKKSPLRSRVTPFHDAACAGWAAAIRLAIHHREKREAAERVGIQLAERIASLGRELDAMTAERNAYRALCEAHNKEG